MKRNGDSFSTLLAIRVKILDYGASVLLLHIFFGLSIEFDLKMHILASLGKLQISTIDFVRGKWFFVANNYSIIYIYIIIQFLT